MTPIVACEGVRGKPRSRYPAVVGVAAVHGAQATQAAAATAAIVAEASDPTDTGPGHGRVRTTTLSAHEQVRHVSYPGGHVRRCDTKP